MYTSIQPRKIVIESSNADAIRVSADTLAYEYTAWAFINKSVPIFLISHILLNQFLIELFNGFKFILFVIILEQSGSGVLFLFSVQFQHSLLQFCLFVKDKF